MKLHESIINLLDPLADIENIKPFLFRGDGDMSLKIEGSDLLKVGKNGIILLSQCNLDKKITFEEKRGIQDNINGGFKPFLDKIAGSVVRLNHVGVSYACDDIEKEIDEYKKLVCGTKYGIYEEDSGFSRQRWFFIADGGNWELPLFEIVLNEPPVIHEWVPHFQIDLDTDLDFKALTDYADSYLGNNFFKWKLDVPPYGVVLAMGFLANIQNTKICLGVGTKTRGVEYKRLFKKII